MLSDGDIFTSPRMNDQFFTLLKVKMFEIPYFESSTSISCRIRIFACYLSNNFK